MQGLWPREWFVAGARAFGPATVQVITQILDRSKIEAQAFLACRNILSELGKKTLLEQACQELLNVNGYPTYTSIKRIMATLALARAQAAGTAEREGSERGEGPARGFRARCPALPGARWA